MMNSTLQQVCLVNADVSTPSSGTVNKKGLSIAMCHQSRYRLYLETVTTFTGGISSAAHSYMSFLRLLQHHLSWTKCRRCGKFLYEAITWVRLYSLLSRVQDCATRLWVAILPSFHHVESITWTVLLTSRCWCCWIFWVFFEWLRFFVHHWSLYMAALKRGYSL